MAFCVPCEAVDDEVRRPLPESYARAIERESGGVIVAYVCRHTGRWHLRFPPTPERTAGPS